MGKLITHYDNLKVARSAPPAVIKAAYRALAQQYHPDVNKDPDASRIMQLVNRAYEVLSNPDLRAEHDAWIRDQERSYPSGPAAGAEWAYTPPRPTSQASAPPPQPEPAPRPQPQERNHYSAPIEAKRSSRLGNVVHGLFWILIAGIGVTAFFNQAMKPRPPSTPYTRQAPSPPIVEPQQFTSQAVSDALAKSNAEPWQAVRETPTERMRQIAEQHGFEEIPNAHAPVDYIARHIGADRIPYSSGYIAGERQLNNDGMSTLTVDNSQNSGDVLVKLVNLDANPTYPVRTFFLTGWSRFKVNDISPGNYDVRYLDRQSGVVSKSQPFQLIERPTADGVEFSNVSMTLYQVADGNMHTERIPESEF